MRYEKLIEKSMKIMHEQGGGWCFKNGQLAVPECIH